MTQLRIAFTLLLTALVGALSAQTLTVMKEKEKYGYADENGKMIIKAQYTQAYPFENGKAKVRKGDKWGYIDEKGKALIAIDYENIEPFENGIARVKKGGKYGYIKEDGTIYIKPEYDFIGTFNEDGWLWVGKGKSLKESNKGLYRHDQLIMKPGPQYLGFYVRTDSADYTDGHPIGTNEAGPAHNEIKTNFCRLSRSTEPYIWTMPLGIYTRIFDLDGLQVVAQQTGAVGMPKDGYSIVRKYANKKGKIYYDFNYVAADGKSKKLFKKDIRQQVDTADIYESCTPFHNGKALCGTESLAYLIDNQGNTLTDMYDRLTPVKGLGYISRQGDRYGLLSLGGQENVAPSFQLILPPFEGSQILPAQDNSTGRFGFIDFSGKQLVPFRFEDAIAFTDGKGYVKENGYYGIVDLQGNYIVKNRWQHILPATTAGCDYLWVQSPETSKWQCLNISRDALSFDSAFDGANSFDDKGRALIMSGDKIGAVSVDGTSILPVRFTTQDIASAALRYLDNEGKSFMNDTEAFRFNIYNNGERHKYRLHQQIADEMWDF